jgi:hypothetical protein
MSSKFKVVDLMWKDAVIKDGFNTIEEAKFWLDRHSGGERECRGVLDGKGNVVGRYAGGGLWSENGYIKNRPIQDGQKESKKPNLKLVKQES